tara:strand:+ start:2835 stop:2960 length:126 start_codon:yes stop_codon:yes gene_type:complete
MEATLLVIPLKVCSFYDFLIKKSLGDKKVAFSLIKIIRGLL